MLFQLYVRTIFQVELALAARPKLLRLYFLRARIYRRLKLWERALADVEMLFSANVPELKDQCQNLIFCILNDFGVDCIKQGSYSEAIVMFNAVLMHIKGMVSRIWLVTKYDFSYSFLYIIGAPYFV